MFTTRGKTRLADARTLEHRASRQGDPRLARACARGHRGLQHRRAAAVAVWRVGRRLGQGVPVAGAWLPAPRPRRGAPRSFRGGQNIRTASGRKAAAEVIDAVRATNRVRDVRSPFAAGNSGQLSRDGRSALVLFNLEGQGRDGARARPARARPGRAHRATQPGAAGRAVRHGVGRQGARRHNRQGLRACRGHLRPAHLRDPLIAFCSLVAALLPLLLALRGRDRDRARGRKPRAADRRTATDAAAHRPRGGRRLLTVLSPPARARSAPPALDARGDRHGGGHVRPVGARLRADRHRRNGRDVPHRPRHVHRHGRGDHPRGRRRGPRLADGPARHAGAARRPRRAGPDPVARQAAAAPTRPRTKPSVGRTLEPRAGAPGAPRRSSRRVPPRLAIPAVACTPPTSPRRRICPRSLPIMQTYEHVQHAFPGGPAPAEVVVTARRRRRSGGDGADRALSARRSPPIRCSSRSRSTSTRTTRSRVVSIPLAGDVMKPPRARAARRCASASSRTPSAARRDGEGGRRDRRLGGLQPPAERAGAARLRLRARRSRSCCCCGASARS